MVEFSDIGRLLMAFNENIDMSCIKMNELFAWTGFSNIQVRYFSINSLATNWVPLKPPWHLLPISSILHIISLYYLFY